MRAAPRRLLPALCALAVVAATLLASAFAAAAPRLDVQQVQGHDAPWVSGWNEAVIKLDNKDGGAWRGELVLDPTYDRRNLDRPTVRVPVTLAAGESVRVMMPFFLAPGSYPTITLVSNGEDEGHQQLGVTKPIETVSTVVEIQGALALGARLVEAPPAAPTPAPTPKPTTMGGDDDLEGKPPSSGLVLPSFGTGAPPTALVSTVQLATESGDPILPDIAGAWSGAVVVVIPSDVLGRLQGRALDALAQWVLSGGTLAVSVVHEEDLGAPTLKTLLGGESHLISGAAGTQTFRGANLVRGDSLTGEDQGDVAPYGLGDVWLLRHDPWARTPDPSSPRALYGLWARAKLRRLDMMAGPFARGVSWLDDARVRLFLDPNQGFRPALGIAALLIVVYAFLVGPIAFARARKLGKPLSVLKATPLIALGLFALLVGLGKIGKGIRGHVRKLEMVDLAAGATRGATTAFHAFYVSDPSTIDLAATHAIDGVHMVDPFVESATIDLDRNGIAVRSVRSHPWQTVVIAEEGAKDVQGGITLEGSGVRLTLINGTPWTLEHVILHPEGVSGAARSRYFKSVAPGATVVARDGVAVERRILPTAAGDEDVVLPSSAKGSDDADKRMFEAIEALAGTAMYGSEPLPSAQPVATAVVHFASPNESGFTVDDDVIFLRVLGLGGGKGKGELESPKPKGSEGDL